MIQQRTTEVFKAIRNITTELSLPELISLDDNEETVPLSKSKTLNADTTGSIKKTYNIVKQVERTSRS